jgi:hypothetical protein
MGLGILGRVLGWAIDGTPSWPLLAFLGYELVSLAVIIVATRATGIKP